MKFVVIALPALLAVGLAGLVGVGWYFSSQVLVPKPYQLYPEFEIAAVEDGSVILPAPAPRQFARTDVEGVYGLVWEGGSGRLGTPERLPDGRVRRELTGVVGAPPEAGAPARIDVALFQRDPQRDHGIPFEEVTLSGQAGALAAWWIDRGADTAVLMLHGRRRADRTETLRSLPTLVDLGYSVLVLGYRNHDRSDPSPDGFYHYGYDEADDALTALAYLRAQGVRRAIVVGFSMGGSVALETLERWPDAGPDPIALVLDAPLLAPREVVRASARAMGLPLADRIADWALFVGRLRSGTRWDDLDHRRTAADLRVPLLLIAGTADSTIPIELVDAFADRVEAPLRYERLDGVEHVEAWNADPDRYAGWLRAFLSETAPIAADRP